MNWNKIGKALEVCVVAESGRYATALEADDAREQDQAADDAFEQLIKPTLARMANTAARSIGVITCLRVRVRALVNHQTKTAQPFAEISWAGKCGRFEIEGIVDSDTAMKLMVDRFKKTLAINRT